jgi:RHS repeat-associated protein
MPRPQPAAAAGLLILLSLLPSPTRAQDEEEYRFTYDGADNLLSRTVVRDGVATEEAMPLDGSGRNRPSSVGGVPLEWDANGNLTRKGDLHLSYDYLNRLIVVRSAAGEELARYAYDASNRRVEEHLGGSVVRTVWSGLQPVETYVDGVLRTRRTYGRSLDEVISVEQDADGDGVLDEVYTPLYDSTGNLALVTDENGKPVERYSYTPNGKRTIYVDLTPPRVVEVRVVGGALWIEVSEMVGADALAAALANGALRLEAAGEAVPLSLAGTIVHARRHRVMLALESPPSPGTAVELRIEPEALLDVFLNKLSEEVVAAFPWPEGDAVVFDAEPPAVYEAAYRDGVPEVEFTEEIDLATATPSIQIAGYVTSWTKSENGYRLTAAAPVPDGTHDLVITEALTDLAGTPLAEEFHLQLHVYPETPFWLAYRAPDLRIVPESTIANDFGFHGLPQDPVTGFLYVRNRYYDPDLARFITPDPMGYLDSPNPYQYAGNNPFNFTDPLGLDAVAIAYVDYEIAVGDRRYPYLGHAAVITIDDTGFTKYFEYGRYDPAKRGLTRSPGVPNVTIGSNGLPTRESLKRLLRSVSQASGQNSRISAAYFATDAASTAKMTRYGLNCVDRNKDPNREPYSTWSNNCGTFVEDVLGAGGVRLPMNLDPRPNGRVPTWEVNADFAIEYDPTTDELKADDRLFTASKEEILEWRALPFWKRPFVPKPR